MQTRPRCNALFKSASAVLPLGVSSNYRYWGPDETIYVERGKGAHIWDVDGNRYIDYRMGYGPAILGHADDRVNEAVIAALERGQSFALSTSVEHAVAEKIVNMCPGVEMVRFANSGTEATMHALRLARAYTRREKVILFEGQYNGVHDYVMFTTKLDSSRRSPIVVPTSSGIPKAIEDLVIMLPFNEPETLERVAKQTWHDVAAILVEPILGNCGGIMPDPGWLECIRDVCDEYGIVFIMDEVKTGFRLAKGGAQEYFGVTADLVTYAKAMGNGYPVAAFGGRRDIMKHLGDGVVHGGTYSGNPISLAAADATLDILMNTDALETMWEYGEQLQNAISEVLEPTGLPFVISGHPSLFIFWFSESPPRGYRDWIHSDNSLYDHIAAGLIRRGVMPEPESREPWFTSAAHSEQDIAETATALAETVKEVLGQ